VSRLSSQIPVLLSSLIDLSEFGFQFLKHMAANNSRGDGHFSVPDLWFVSANLFLVDGCTAHSYQSVCVCVCVLPFAGCLGQTAAKVPFSLKS
jgi:hypothetical protein